MVLVERTLSQRCTPYHVETQFRELQQFGMQILYEGETRKTAQPDWRRLNEFMANEPAKPSGKCG
jgi:hypothetical protein